MQGISRMQADAYRRARKLLSSRRDHVIARVLGFVQSLLLVALLGVIALFVALMASRARRASPRAEADQLPAVGDQPRRPGEDRRFVLFDDTGIFPLIAGNLLSDNPVHRRRRARALSGRPRLLPTLRTNLGALDDAAGAGAGRASCLIALVVAIWRRTVIAAVATEVATTLRRQIHRQMYRLGQSSLPTEGVGPVINLWTREVNDIRDGVIADLDVTPRTHVLAAGLLVLALLVSPMLTVFLASLGLLVWLTARSAEPRRPAGVRGGVARRLGPALPAPRRPGPAPDGSGLRRRGVRPAAVRRAPRAVSSRPTPGGSSPAVRSTRAPACSSEPPWRSPWGCWATTWSSTIRSRSRTMLILLVSLAGLAYPITEWLRHEQGDPPGQSLGPRHLRVPRAAGPSFIRTSAPSSSNALKEQIAIENVALESRSGRGLLEGVSVEIPAGLAHGHHGRRTTIPSSPWPA